MRTGKCRKNVGAIGKTLTSNQLKKQKDSSNQQLVSSFKIIMKKRKKQNKIKRSKLMHE